MCIGRQTMCIGRKIVCIGRKTEGSENLIFSKTYKSTKPISGSYSLHMTCIILR
jgi:hypothetical protein